MSWASAGAFHHHLAMLLRSGLTMAQALEHAGGTTSGRHARLARRWSTGCGRGERLAPQMERDGEEPLAVAVVTAGEASGRLPELCQDLSTLYDHRRTLRALFLGKLIYPVILVHVAMLGGGLVRWFQTGAVGALLLPPAILWGALGLAGVAFALAHRAGLTARWALLPGVRTLSSPLIAGNTCLVLRAGILAGMLYHQALELAAGACGNRVVAADLRRIAGDLASGRTPDLCTALGNARFPRAVLQLVQTGETAGTLDETLGRAATLQRESFRERTLWATRLAAGTCYAAAMGFAAWTILDLGRGYVEQINAMGRELEG